MRQRLEDACDRCGYDVSRHAVGEACPECGAPVIARTIVHGRWARAAWRLGLRAISLVAPPGPLRRVHALVVALAAFSAANLVVSVAEMALWPDSQVFVARVGGSFGVWPDVFAFQADTGQRWTGLPPADTDLLAEFHGGRREYLMSDAWRWVTVFALSLLTLHAVRRAALVSAA